jgi:hypothetical protein
LETTYTYDISGNATNIYQQKWNTASTQWENFTMNDYTFNSYNQVTSHTNSDWLGGTWEYDFRNIYTYELYDDLVSGIETQAVTDIAIYPNPAGEWTIISFQPADKNKAELKVFDFTGKEIFSAFFEDQYTLLTAHWSSGVYFVKIITDKSELVKKLVKN